MPQSIRVLYATNEPEFGEVVKDALEANASQLSVHVVASTSEVLEQLDGADCLITEFTLAETDGVALLAAVRDQDPDFPVILYPDDGTFSMASRAISAGVSELFAQDPGDAQFEELAERIVELVGAYRTERDREDQLQRLQLALEGTSTGIWEYDIANDTITRHSGASDLWGQSAHITRPADKMLADQVHPDDVERVRAELDRATESNYSYHVEFRVRDADDGYRWVQSNGQHVPAETGPGSLIGFVTDITARKERAQELERYEALIETLPIGYARTSLDGEFLAVNSTFVSLLDGTDEEQITQRRVEVFYRDPDTRSNLIAKLKDTGRVVNEEVKVTTLDGREIWVSITARLLELEDEPYADAIVQDITARKNRNRELERYETIIEASGDAMYTLDADGCLTFVNDAFCELVDYPEEALVGEYVSMVMTEEDIERGQDIITDLLASDEDHATWVMDLIRADGERVTVENHMAILPFEAEFRGTTGIHRDITEQKQREAELKRQNERLDEFARVVSHDLRNPLNVAEGRLELARQAVDNEHLAAIGEAHDRMKALIDDLLMLAQEGGELDELRAVGLGELSERCWSTVETNAATFRNHADTVVRADEPQLQQLLENLFANAVEHAGDGVTVTLGSLEDGFFVEDDGPGIPPAERERVLESGYSTAKGGTGFGLSIVKRIVDAHEWDITVTESEEGGARFEITGVTTVD